MTVVAMAGGPLVRLVGAEARAAAEAAGVEKLAVQTLDETGGGLSRLIPGWRSGEQLLFPFAEPASVGTLQLGQAASSDYRATFFAAYPELEGRVIVHHAVEQQVLERFPGMVTEAEMHSIENLRGISLGVNSKMHLSQIRIEWNRFYESFAARGTVPTRTQVLQKAAEIDAKYGSKFTPPIGGAR